MRVVLVGPAGDRARVRLLLNGSGLEIVGEVATLGAARAGDFDADAILVASAHLTQAQSADEVIEPLTPREIEVLELLSEGFSNKSIAARLMISDQTVKFHVSAICGKLGAANRTEAVRRAVRRGLITL